MEKRIRVLVAKPGLDGHDRGAKVVARALRDAGFEVIYTGLRQTPEQIAEAALQEDVNVVAMSILSGAHPHLFPKVVNLVREKGMDDVLIIGGGVIPETDIPALKEAGVAEVFTPGTPTSAIVDFIKANVNVVAMSILSGAHPHLFPKVVNLVREKGMDDVLIIGGGVIPETDIPALKEAGVAEVFTPGTPTSAIVDFIKANVK